MMKARSRAVGLALLAASCGGYMACDDSVPVKERLPSTSPTAGDAGTNASTGSQTLPDGGPKDCFDNPKTHLEIINACTTATKITKTPALPRLHADGGLPPLN
jgi:hypothetical protein